MMDGLMKSTMKVLPNGTKEWRNESGELHRLDGPAAEFANGDNSWWLNGKLHREDGPAVERLDGYKMWYINDKRYSFDNYCIKLYGSIDHHKSIMLHVKYG